MAFLYRSVASTALGQVHTVKSWDGWIQFDQDAPFRTVEPALFTQIGFNGYAAVYKAHDTGLARLVDRVERSEQIIAETVGNSPCRFGPEGVYVQTDGLTRLLSVYDTEGEFHIFAPAPYSPEGIGDILPSGEVRMRGLIPGQFDRKVLGVQLWSVRDAGPWVVGVASVGLSGGVVAINTTTGEKRMLVIETQVPIEAAVDTAGLLHVAISAEGSPEPADFMRLSTIYDPMPPVVVGPQRALWLDDMSGLVPTNCGGTGTNGAILEDVDWLTEADKPKLLALYFGKEMPPHLGGSKSDHYQRTFQSAQVLGVPVAVYDDGDDAWAAEWTQTAERDGLRCWRLFNCYLRPGESDEGLERRIGLKVEAETRPCGLVLPGYLVGGASPETTARSYYAALRIWQANPQVVALLVFGLDRPPRFTWGRLFVEALSQQTPTPPFPAHQPAVPVKPPVPPQPPIVVPPVVTPPVVVPSPRPRPDHGHQGAGSGWQAWVEAFKRLFRKR